MQEERLGSDGADVEPHLKMSTPSTEERELNLQNRNYVPANIRNGILYYKLNGSPKVCCSIHWMRCIFVNWLSWSDCPNTRRVLLGFVTENYSHMGDMLCLKYMLRVVVSCCSMCTLANARHSYSAIGMHFLPRSDSIVSCRVHFYDSKVTLCVQLCARRKTSFCLSQELAASASYLTT